MLYQLQTPRNRGRLLLNVAEPQRRRQRTIQNLYTVVTTDRSGIFPFLKLPAELRNMVYEYLRLQMIPSSILCLVKTCHQIYKELLPLLYHDVKMVDCIHLANFLRQIGHNAPLVTSIHLVCQNGSSGLALKALRPLTSLQRFSCGPCEPTTRCSTNKWLDSGTYVFRMLANWVRAAGKVSLREERLKGITFVFHRLCDVHLPERERCGRRRINGGLMLIREKAGLPKMPYPLIEETSA